jgi:hypothetical protein
MELMQPQVIELVRMDLEISVERGEGDGKETEYHDVGRVA